MQVAGALAAHDSESKISPLSKPLGTLAGFMKAAELLRLDLLSWSAGPIPQARDRFSALCCSAITIPTRLVFAGRVGSGINQTELERLWRRRQPLATDKMPLEVIPGSPSLIRPMLPLKITWYDISYTWLSERIDFRLFCLYFFHGLQDKTDQAF
jgi:hypothetical protein